MQEGARNEGCVPYEMGSIETGTPFELAWIQVRTARRRVVKPALKLKH